MEVYPNRIRELRKARGWSLETLASLCDPPTTNQQISRLEKNDRRLTVEWMERLSKALGCRPSDLLIETADPQAPRTSAVVMARETPMSVGPLQVDINVNPVAIRVRMENTSMSDGTHTWFGKEFIERNRLDPDSCEVIMVRDSSMAPILCPGSACLVNLRQTELFEHAFYAAEFENDLYLRRALKSGNGWYLAPEDSALPSLFCDDPLRILGQLIWTARMLTSEGDALGTI